MKFFCLSIVLFLMCCQKQEWKKHYITIKIDGQIQRFYDLTEVKPRQEIVIYCYYLNDKGIAIKDGEECIYRGYETINNFYRDGVRIESIATAHTPGSS